MYPDRRVSDFIRQEFIPVRSHVKETPALWGRFGTRWTPTVLFLDQRGHEQHRLEGFLPTDEFLAQLHLGRGLCAAGVKDWKTAETHFARVVDELPNTDAAPAALYWRGVCRYSVSHDADDLQDIWRAFQKRYANTAWAKRTVVWKPKDAEAAA